MKNLKRIQQLIRPYGWQIALSSLVLLSVTGIDLAFPAIIRQVIDFGLSAGQHNLLVTAALVIVGLSLLKSVLLFGQRYLNEWIAHHVAFDLRNRLYNHIQRLSFSFHDHSQSGQLISRFIEDVRSLQSFTGVGVVELVRVILLLTAITFVLFTSNARLAAIALLPMIPLVLVTTSFGKVMGRLFLNVDNIMGELSSRLQENVVGVQVVRAFAREPYEIRRFDEVNRGLFHAQIRVVRMWARNMPTTTLLVTLGTILILWFGGQMVLRGELTLGELVAFNSYMLLMAMPSQQLGWIVNSAGEASAGLQRTFEILETYPEIQSPSDPVRLGKIEGRVTFDGVSFQYTGEDTPALHDLELDVAPNQVIALIGPTGSGKTSLVNLIPRFYDPGAGSVRVDGIDLRDVDIETLRRQIGIVLQTSLLFSTTIRENLRYGRPDATESEIIAAAKSAQAHDFILELPKGYDTIVGERGITLSGGQRQRIAIGRALLMDPRILILDDSTSSVDTQTEHLIQMALNHLMEGRTTFVIAQRLSTVRRADLILVMDDGRIIERGVHQELLINGGLYRQIYELQLRDQERFQEELVELETNPDVVMAAEEKGLED